MNKSEDKKEYEVSFLARNEEDSQKIMEAIKKVSSEIVMEGPIMRTALAYPIDKQESAFFGYVHVMMDPHDAKTLEKVLRLDSPAMRSLILTPPPGKATSKSTDSRGATPRAVSPDKPKEPRQTTVLSNEDLEKKIEEILQ